MACARRVAGLFTYGGVVASQSLCGRSLCFESLIVYLDACQFQYQSVFLLYECLFVGFESHRLYILWLWCADCLDM